MAIFVFLCRKKSFFNIFVNFVDFSYKGAFYLEFYQILSEIMSEKGMSISQVASICGLRDSTVRSIIHRKQKRVFLDVAFKMKKGLGVSLQRLNGEIEEDTVSDTRATIGDERLDEIVNIYHQLNESGKDEMAKQAEHLTYMPEYKKCGS